MRILNATFVALTLIVSLGAAAHEAEDSRPRPMGSTDCTEMEVWDYSVAMCMPLAMKDMPMTMVMLHGNGFLAQVVEEGPRGRNAFVAPNMFMTDVGTTLGDHNYLNLDFMGTLERWTFPSAGYPELLQIGEENQDHFKFIDAQHPHSSPVMGLTVSDTISLGHEKDHLKFSFALRGQATDGPVAFMHRATGMVNPDAPLGHHIGQDVGHITSTVLAGSLRLGRTTFEFSTFNGTEPQPSNVDLPMGALNSYAARLTEEFTPHVFAMASLAFVKSPEPTDPSLDHVSRYSASLYDDHTFSNGWMIHNAFIYGLVNGYDDIAALNSFAEEFWFHKAASNIWGRIEYLQRASSELMVASVGAAAGAAVGATDPLWVTALTVGYTHKLVRWDSADLGLGASVTKDLLPSQFRDAYGGNPLSAKVFLQLGGMKMWDL